MVQAIPPSLLFSPLLPSLTHPQVHADATLYPPNLTKQAAYAHLHASLISLLDSQRNWVCALANTASLLWHLYHSLPSPSSSVNWTGFYVRDKLNPKQLILGPFMGKVACQTIAIGRGVCGTVAEKGEAVVVDDVETFPGHIACDGESRSEVVVPILVEGEVSCSFAIQGGKRRDCANGWLIGRGGDRY